MLFDEWDDRQSQTQARANAAIAASTSSTSRGMVRNSSMTHTGYSSEEDEKLPPAPRQNRAQTGDHGSDSDGEGPHKPSTTTESHEYGDGEEDAPAMFHVEKLDWRPTREQGALVDLSVASNVLVIATSANYLIRWNLDVDEFDEIQISKRQDDSIHRVAIDPTGSHILVSLESGNNFYIHAKWTKPHQLTKIKGLVIESVAWNNAQGTVDSTKRILLGTTKGLIFECQMDEKQHDKYAKKVYDLNEPDAKETTPISGLYMEQFPSSESDAPKYFVMAATPTRQYQFIGGPTFDAMFLKYQSNPAFLELPGTLGYSELRFFSPNMKQDKTAVAETCAWLSGPGIYYGKLVFGSQDQPGDKVVEDGSLLAYPAYPGSGPSSAVIPPLSLILTRFHFLLLNKNRLVAINQLSEEIVFEDVFNTQQMGTMIRFAHDMRKDTIWLLSDKCVYEVEIISEDREVWKLYLAEGRFADALEYCDTPYQEEQVMNAQADHTFAQGAYELSASIYAKTQRSFEEVTLKFVNIGLTHPEAKSALKTYLSAKLDTLSPQDLTQQTMICTWLTEIYLDNLNHLQDPPIDDDHLYPTDPSIPQLSDEERKEKREQEHREFREFLDHYFDCLNKETTFALISSHGRVDDLLFYARIIGDLEWILNHHCEQHEYDEALEVLATHKDHVKNAEIYYKFTPTLLQHRPKETVDMLIQMKGLDPSKLFPALMRYDASRTVDTTTSADGETSNQAIRYLEHVIKQRNKDPAIHNYLVSLYAKQADDVPLLRFIEAHKSKPIFDYKYALRLCHQEKKLRACVGIYTAMELYEEAVELSLQVDVNVAKRVVAQASTRITPQQRRRLWLIIARHVIETEQHVTKALEILKESELKFEDLLPYFPDFVRIGEFKEEICNSLDSYNRSIEQLKSEMDEYTNSAEMIRKDISELRNRFGIVTSSQRCDLCSQPVLTRPFYLFPCTHVFHIDCMISHVTEYLEKNPQLKAQVLAGVDEKDASSHPTLPASNSHSSIPSSTTLTSSNSQPAPQPSPSTSSSTTSSLLNRMESVLSDKERERERAERERARLLAQEKLVRQQKAMESFASSECLFCGQMMIDSVHNPFIELPAEKEEVASWQI